MKAHRPRELPHELSYIGRIMFGMRRESARQEETLDGAHCVYLSKLRCHFAVWLASEFELVVVVVQKAFGKEKKREREIRGDICCGFSYR